MNMALQIMWFPALIIIGIIIMAVVYWITKSLTRVGYSLQIIFALGVFALSIQLVDVILISIVDLLGLGLLINGIILLFKK